MRGRHLLAGILVLGTALLAACGGGSSQSSSPSTVTLTGIEPNPLNNLSALVTFTAGSADSARAVYQADGQPQRSTPFQPVSPGPNTIVVLGLEPTTLLHFSVETQGPDGSSSSAVRDFSTGALPAALQNVHLEIVGTPAPGFVLTAAFLGGTDTYALAFDETGEIRWYRQFTDGLPAGETKQQPNGNITVFLGSTPGFTPTEGRFVEIRPSGEIVHEYSAGPAFFTDNHELLLTFDGNGNGQAHYFGYDLRTVDLSIFGGLSDAQVAGHVLLRQSLSGTTDFLWSGWDHLAVTDWIEPPDENKLLANIDFDHPNSLDFDLDGNYVVSFRSFGEVAKIDATTGDFIWRLGGNNNQFAILDDPLGGFSAQHSARILDNGNLLLYDNGFRHVPQETRAVEYALDVPARTANLVWEYRHDPPIFTPFVGAVQRLASGNTLVAFGGAGHIVEADPGEQVVWEGDLLVNGQIAPVYRAIRIASLYEYRKP